MFLHLSVCHSVHRVGTTWAGTPRAGTPPGQVHPPGRYTPRAGKLPGQVPPPRPQCMLGYGQQVGGTRPTGMHSCSESG